MNWAQFKDPVSHVYLTGIVVASWSLTQEVASSSPFTVITNIFCHWIQGNIWEKLHTVMKTSYFDTDSNSINEADKTSLNSLLDIEFLQSMVEEFFWHDRWVFIVRFMYYLHTALLLTYLFISVEVWSIAPVSNGKQWRKDPGFPRGGGANSPLGGANIRFCQIFPKTAWNWKNLDPRGGGARPKFYYVDPPLVSVMQTAKVIAKVLQMFFSQNETHILNMSTVSVHCKYRYQCLSLCLKIYTPCGKFSTF